MPDSQRLKQNRLRILTQPIIGKSLNSRRGSATAIYTSAEGARRFCGGPSRREGLGWGKKRRPVCGPTSPQIENGPRSGPVFYLWRCRPANGPPFFTPPQPLPAGGAAAEAAGAFGACINRRGATPSRIQRLTDNRLRQNTQSILLKSLTIRHPSATAGLLETHERCWHKPPGRDESGYQKCLYLAKPTIFRHVVAK